MFKRPIVFGFSSTDQGEDQLRNALTGIDLHVARQDEVEDRSRIQWDTRKGDYDLFEQFDGITHLRSPDVFARISESYPDCKTILFDDTSDNAGNISSTRLEPILSLASKMGLDCFVIGRRDIENCKVLADFLDLDLGHVRARQDAARNWSGNKLSFIVPVVHPQANHLQSYETVERILKESVHSYTSQEGADTNLIVICHNLPDWAQACDGRVTFINLGDHPVFFASKLGAEVDKGLKHLIGILFARQVQSASAIMFGDGDDFVRTDLARTALTKLEDHLGGLVITVGNHAHLTPIDTGFEVAGVLRVSDFYLTCGTDRVFRTDHLSRCMHRWHPGLLTAKNVFKPGDHPNEIRVSDSFLNWFWETAEPRRANDIGLMCLLGRHEEKNAVFDHAFWPEPLVTKGCGHGNHDGPRKGEVHWHRTLAMKSRGEFITEFGLDPKSFKIDGWHPWVWARALSNAVINRFKV